MILHRKQLIQRLRDYPHEHRLFLEATRQEYYAMVPALPRDSVKSPVIDAMPHGTAVSNPTLAMICQRETIIERLQQRQAALDAELMRLTDHLLQFWDWWQTLTDIEQKFVELRYWKRASYQEIERFFRAESTRYYGDVPDAEDKVYRFEERLLQELDHLWYYAPSD